MKRAIGTAAVLGIFLSCCLFGQASAEQPLLPDLTGRWITIQHLETYALLPLIGEIRITTTIALYSDVVQHGATLILTDAYCFTDVGVSTDLFATDVPDGVMQSLRPDPRHAELVADGDRICLIQDWHTEVRGAKLENPVHDPLPISSSDPRLVDQEGDGEMGITIPVELVGLLSGETYATQRFRYRLEGDLIDSDTIAGYVDWTTEQSLVGATDALFFMPYTQYTDPDPEKHRFVMMRVDETWDCETARTALDSLLGTLYGLRDAGHPEIAGETPAAP